MQHETAPGIDRTSALDREVAGAFAHPGLANWTSTGLQAAIQIEILDKFLKSHWLRTIEDKAHGAVLGMGAYENDRALEALVIHSRHRDEEMPVQASPVTPGQMIFYP